VTVAERLEAVRARIAAAGGSGVRVVAVTKGFGADAIEAAVAAGCPTWARTTPGARSPS
jgi:uncharacterized pyridoxal phosphate-containing UPF0001 family protein